MKMRCMSVGAFKIKRIRYFSGLVFLFACLQTISLSASEERYEHLMQLRMEVESLNETWETEKKRSKADYEKALERLAALKDETAKQSASLDLVRARIRGFQNREAETRRVSGHDIARLKRTIGAIRDDFKAMLPVGRETSIGRLEALLGDLENKSSEEIVDGISKVMREELVKARGVHLFRETHQISGAATPLEIARIGNVYAYVADASGKFGIWKWGESAPSWGLAASEAKNAKMVLEQARMAKKTFSIETGPAEAEAFGGAK